MKLHRKLKYPYAFPPTNCLVCSQPLGDPETYKFVEKGKYAICKSCIEKSHPLELLAVVYGRLSDLQREAELNEKNQA